MHNTKAEEFIDCDDCKDVCHARRFTVYLCGAQLYLVSDDAFYWAPIDICPFCSLGPTGHSK